MASGVEQQIASAASKLGFNRAAIAGLIGNATQESNLNPGLNEPSAKGLFSWSAVDGNPQASKVQLGNVEQQVQLAAQAIGPHGIQAMNRAGSPGAAAQWFEQNFEKAGTPMMQNRINAANQAFSSGIGAQAQGQGGGTLSAMPPGSNQVSVQTQVPTFNQQGYNQAQQAYKLGTVLNLQAQANPFGKTPAALSSGPSTLGQLFSHGLATTTAPNIANFQGTKTVTQQLQVAQQGLQGSSNQEVSHAPQAAQAKVQSMTALANAMLGKPYIYGGGHGSFGNQGSPGVDCSGFVSAVLHAGGYLSQPVDTTSLPSQAGIQSGSGKYVTIYDNTNAGQSGHVIIKIGNQFYEAGGSHNNVAKIAQPSDLSFFNAVLHPAGL